MMWRPPKRLAKNSTTTRVVILNPEESCEDIDKRSRFKQLTSLIHKAGHKAHAVSQQVNGYAHFEPSASQPDLRRELRRASTWADQCDSQGSHSVPVRGYGTPRGAARSNPNLLQSSPMSREDMDREEVTPIGLCRSPVERLSFGTRLLTGAGVGSGGGPGPYEIFMLYSSPLGHAPIGFREEAEMFSEALGYFRSNVQVNISVATETSFSRLLTLARSRRGLVLHLSAHAIKDEATGNLGLVLEDAQGKSHVLWREKLEQLLNVGDGLRNLSLLFLSTCHSEEMARIFIECGCRHVIAKRGLLHDTAARRFSLHFYSELAAGGSVLTAFEGARQALRISADEELAVEADYMTLYGQHGAEKGTLETLCGEASQHPAPGSSVGQMMQEFEEVTSFLEARLPQRRQDFFGREEMIAKVSGAFRGQDPNIRRMLVLSGAPGIGKSAFGIEYAHYASAPGRLFSCAAMYLRIDVPNLDNIIGLLDEQVESLAVRVGILSQMACDGYCTPRSAMSSRSARSESSLDYPMQGGGDVHAVERARIRQRLRQIETMRCRDPRAKQHRRVLIVIDDNACTVKRSADVRSLLNEIIENTQRVHFLILSREPVYECLDSVKIVNHELSNLSIGQSANLFMMLVHRPLHWQADLRGELPEPEPSRMRDRDQLCRHPLLRRLGGNPDHIRTVASRVIPGGPRLDELYRQTDLIDPPLELPRTTLQRSKLEPWDRAQHRAHTHSLEQERRLRLPAAGPSTLVFSQTCPVFH